MRDSEELMNTIRQYLKQKVARGFSSKQGDLDNFKKELRDEITHILYDQTRRTPIVIPVVNEIGGNASKPQQHNQDQRRPAQRQQRPDVVPRQQPKRFPRPVVADSEVQIAHIPPSRNDAY